MDKEKMKNDFLSIARFPAVSDVHLAIIDEAVDGIISGDFKVIENDVEKLAVDREYNYIIFQHFLASSLLIDQTLQSFSKAFPESNVRLNYKGISLKMKE